MQEVLITTWLVYHRCGADTHDSLSGYPFLSSVHPLGMCMHAPNTAPHCPLPVQTDLSCCSGMQREITLDRRASELAPRWPCQSITNMGIYYLIHHLPQLSSVNSNPPSILFQAIRGRLRILRLERCTARCAINTIPWSWPRHKAPFWTDARDYTRCIRPYIALETKCRNVQ
jgi:hypothetical protein